MRIDVLGQVSVSNGDAAISGQALGGRRARVALVALALSPQAVPADRLASMIWADELPATWQVALRGVVRGLRSVLAPIGGGDQHVVSTAPSGYQLAPGIEVDVRLAEQAVRRAAELLAEGRPAAALELVEPISDQTGDQLLPGEDAEWLAPHRTAADATAASRARTRRRCGRSGRRPPHRDRGRPPGREPRHRSTSARIGH